MAASKLQVQPRHWMLHLALGLHTALSGPIYINPLLGIWYILGMYWVQSKGPYQGPIVWIVYTYICISGTKACMIYIP